MTTVCLCVCSQLLKDNLYEFQRYLANMGQEPFFTVPRLQRVARQTLEALAFVHALDVIHCDLKPENILIKSYSRYPPLLLVVAGLSTRSTHPVGLQVRYEGDRLWV